MSAPHIRLCGMGSVLLGRSWETGSGLLVGREREADIALNDATVSRRHAEVVWDDRHWVLRDLGSTNGTLLNGREVGRTGDRLRPHDILQFGSVKLVATLVEPSRDHTADTPFHNAHETLVQMVTGLAKAIGFRDGETGKHVQRVADYAVMLAQELHLSPGDCQCLQIGAPLHDIGKIGISDAILGKPGSLSPDEWQIVKSHALRGVAILEAIPQFGPILAIIRSHHERWNGEGYPDGLSGEQIPMLARIVAVADAFDAMTSNRPYRQALDPADAFAELERKAGIDFDPACVQAFLALRPRIEKVFAQRNSTHNTTLHMELEELAYFDHLTGLPNRRFFEEQLPQILVQAHVKGKAAALLFIDLDGFKAINDTLGHLAGDRLLQLVAERLKGRLRENDIAARFGGDEFVVVLGGIADSQNAATVARKIVEVLAMPFTMENRTNAITASIGISLFPDHGKDPKTLLRKADKAMYQAKERGKNNAQFYCGTSGNGTRKRPVLA